MIRGLDIFSKCVKVESGIGAAGVADFVPELLVPANALDGDGANIPDPFVESTWFVDSEGATSGPEELKETEEVLPEAEKADCTGTTPDAEEEERVDTDELAEFGDVRPGIGAGGELLFCVDELWT